MSETVFLDILLSFKHVEIKRKIIFEKYVEFYFNFIICLSKDTVPVGLVFDKHRLLVAAEITNLAVERFPVLVDDPDVLLKVAAVGTLVVAVRALERLRLVMDTPHVALQGVALSE